jgi:RHS repeat-associated protein
MGQWSYTYDSLNRVISGSPASGNTANAGLNLCWSYDAFGNRTAQAAQSTACPSVSSPPFPTAAYNTNNQVTFVQNTAPMGYSYDASGDVTSDNTNTYLYDAEGRICAVRSEPVAGTYTMTGYLYDADGTRVAKGTITNWSCDPATSGLSTTNDYILGQGGEQMTEMTMNGDGSTLVWEHTNVFAGGKIIATYSQDNTGSQTQNSALHFYLDDPLGSRRVQTDYAGVVEKSCQSLPFGDGETCLATPTEHLFTGKERDAESGNDYFGARYYNSSVGRFLSPDPFLNSGHPEDPQSWNRYSYVRNNPLGRTDPTGLYDFSKCAKGDSNCQAEKDRFNTGIKKANALLKGMDPKSKEAKELSKALKALGSAGDKNGVTVAFGKTVTGGDMETAGSHITVDFNAVDQSQLAAGKNIDGVVDDAADEVHEGIHVARYERGQPGSGEEEAYRATSYVGEAGHSNLSTGVWDESWAKGPDKELLRNNAIKDAVKRSEDATKEYEDKQKQ